MYIVHDQMINSYFANHRSQCCFSWGNLPDDLLHYILQIHASNIIRTSLEIHKTFLRGVQFARRGHIHFHYAVWGHYSFPLLN